MLRLLKRAWLRFDPQTFALGRMPLGFSVNPALRARGICRLPCPKSLIARKKTPKLSALLKD